MQALSKVRAGKEKEIEQELRKYADGMDSGEIRCPYTRPPIADVKSLYQPRSLSALPMTMGKLIVAQCIAKCWAIDWVQVRRAWKVRRSSSC